MIRARMLVAAITTVAFAALTVTINHHLATVNHRTGEPSVGAPQLNVNSVSEIAGDPLDNAREGDGTIYGYRV